MQARKRLSLFVAIIISLQLILPIWSNQNEVSAAVIGPTIVSLSPATGTSNVPTSAIFKATFDESIMKNDLTKKIQIYKYSSNSLVKEYLMSDSKVTVSNNVLTLDAKLLSLALDTDYYILIEAGAVANVSNSVLFNGINNATTWNFHTISTVETVKPKISSVTSGLCATNVSNCSPTVDITSPLQFVFDEDVYVAGGNISLTSSKDNRTISVLSNEVQGSGSRVITLTPSTPLAPATTYTLTITGSNITDASGNYYAGGSWKFITDASPVQLISQSPAVGATNAAVGSNLVLNFSQSVQGSSTKNITIRKVSNNEVVYERATTHSSLTYSNANTTVTVNTGSVIKSDTSYYVTIDAGAFTKVGDSNAIYYGIPNATDWVFTTSYDSTDKTPPKLVTSTVTPKNGSTNAGSKEKIVLTFDENVYMSSGTIEIREYNSDTLYRSIPVTSSRLTGGGSKTITIDPHIQVGGEAAKSFSLATKYYVTVSNTAFSDAAGNYYAGISTKIGYNFQVSATASAPQIETISPANAANTVATTSKFKATFDKSVIVDRGYTVSFNPTATNGTTIMGTLVVDPNNAKGVIITPNEELSRNTEYYINISDNSIMDINGNYFIGILNQYQWKFRTVGSDTTPPFVSKAEVSGNMIRLVYNKLLNEDLSPAPASFYATVGGNARNISKVKIEGNVVFITLVSSVTDSQSVLLSYTKPSIGRVQDLSENQAESFENMSVSNGFTGNNPTVKSSSYSGSTITLTLTETLDTVSTLAYTQFTVRVNGTNYTINKMTNSGANLTITLNKTIPSNSSIVVSYVSGLYPLKGSSNGTVASFNHTVGTTSTDTSTAGAPTIQYITQSGSKLYLKYNKALKTSSKPATYQYAVLANGKAVSITTIDISNDTIILNLGSTPNSDNITVTYYGTSSTLLDSDYNPAASFTSMQVGTSGTETGSVVAIQGAVLKGSTLTLNFSGNLDAKSVPSKDQFLVRVANNSRIISNISIIGSKVILELSTGANVGDTATVSYFSQDNMLKSLGGNTVGGFTNFTVANQTTVLDTLSDDYASAPNGLLLKTSASSTSRDTSPGGLSAKRYTIPADTLITAVTSLASANMKTADIVFEVPSSERAAIVAYSIAALQAAMKNGSYTLVVNYGDLSYSIPLSSIDLSKAATQSGGNSASNYLRIAFEEGSTSATTDLVTAINRSGATIVEGPFAYEVTVVNGSRSEDAVIKGNLTRTSKTTTSLTYGNTTAVFYDEGISAISSVPTTFSNDNNTTTITFKRPGNSAYAVVKNTKSFSDTASHWANSSITIMTRKFIVEGQSSTAFNPSTNITRGEFATYIVKGLGLSANKEAAKKFKDVNSNTVMGGYIGAAVESGIVAGVSSTTFEPNSYITRQDMALMMVRAASYAGLTTKLSVTADSVLKGYTDKSQISSYAKTGVAMAVNVGIISGTTTTQLSPKKNATRAEGTIMIMRLLKETGNIQY